MPRNPYKHATNEQLIDDEVALSDIRARLTEAINTVKKTFGEHNMIASTNFLAETYDHLESALTSIEQTENDIRKEQARR
jgi:hypothetical protein